MRSGLNPSYTLLLLLIVSGSCEKEKSVPDGLRFWGPLFCEILFAYIIKENLNMKNKEGVCEMARDWVSV